jgi:hypothetical protein
MFRRILTVKSVDPALSSAVKRARVDRSEKVEALRRLALFVP